eukprot:m.95817 g.95817  ORF g.95817 m.95817 type:complete len:378 (+) comp15030_c1_seq2:1861-2994(+)
MAFIARRTGNLSLGQPELAEAENEPLEFIRERFEEMAIATSGSEDKTKESTNATLSLGQAMAINELRETEADYLAKLLELKELYYDPMMATGGLSPMQVEGIFQNMNTLTMISKNILEHCSLTDPINAIIGMSLDKTVVPAFTHYCSHHEAAMLQYRHLAATNKTFAAFMQQPRHEPSGKQAQGLESYLLQPVQRVARYQLILANIYKHTDCDDTRRGMIAVALDAMRDLARQINEQIASHQNTQVLVQLAEQFKDPVISSRLIASKQLMLDLPGVMVRTFTATKPVPKRGGHRRRCLIVQGKDGEAWLVIARRGATLSASKYTTEAMLPLSQWNGMVLQAKQAIVLKPLDNGCAKQGYVLVVESDRQLTKLITAIA